jgi:aquaporin-10
VAPMVGATLGTAEYQLLVALHHPEDLEPFPKVMASQLKASDLVTLAQLECKL